MSDDPKKSGTGWTSVFRKESRRADDRVDKLTDTVITSYRYQLRVAYVVIVILVAAVLALASVNVGLEIPGIGSLTAGE